MKLTARSFFSPEQKEDLKLAIQNAELDTSGEVRIHLETSCKGEANDRAVQIFKTLGMDKTELRNGVLFYLAVKNRKFAVIGDSGINRMVDENFWEHLKALLIENFAEGKFTEGLILGVSNVGEELKKYFPHKPDDTNELPDELSFGDE
ncbi:MAG TPA: TPM domain-containing protein [Bacteroidales bacterium]|nr:TPM domain-containing protein [Bacteroidales bacterium]HPT02172.1 TPM domain-containing protein [Bacteroidales bacterium]